MRLYLIRHARTLPTGPDSRSWPLSPGGEAEAGALAAAPLWSEVSALYSSPERKAVSTVRPSADRKGLGLLVDARLREARRPARWIDDYEAVVRRYLEHPEHPPSGWEPVPEVRARMEECLGDIKDRHPQGAVAVCGHGLALTLYLGSLPLFRGSIFDLWRSMGFARIACVEDGRAAPFADPAGTAG